MKKLVFGILIAFGLISVSFGAWIPEDVEKNYQKLKAEVEEYGGEECKWSEDDKKFISGRLCEFQNVLAFFDEIRARQVKADCGKKKFCQKEDREYGIAMKEVREMPRFKNDIGIYAYVRGDRGSMNEMAYFNKEKFWESVFDKWDTTKRQLRINGARSGYWKKLAE